MKRTTHRHRRRTTHWVALTALSLATLAAGGCGNDPADLMKVYASYTITISARGQADPDVLTVGPGSMGKLLLTFTAGVTTDPMASNSTGLRATLDGTTVRIA